MKKLLVLPTWILIRLMTPILPATHIWKGRKFTLKDWAYNSTDLTNSFSIMLWGQLILVPFFFYQLRIN